MRYFCPGCGTKYNKPDDEVPAEGMSVACEKCGFNITIKAPRRRPSSRVNRAKSSTKSEKPGVSTPPASKASKQGSSAPANNDQDWPSDDLSDHEDEAPKTQQDMPAQVEDDSAPSAPEAEPRDDEQPGGATETEAKPQAKAEPAPRTEKKRPKVKKEKKARSALLSGYLESLGTGKSGSDFRFRDLFYTLSAGADYRKVLVIGTMVFAGSLLFAGLSWLGALTKSSVGVIIGTVLGGLLLWAAIVLGMAVCSYLTDREMEQGRRLPLREGISWVTSRPLAVLGTPFLYVVGILICAAVVAVLALIGRIPYAGPLLYGLTFGVSFAFSFVAVLLALLFGVTTFSYVPALAREQLGPWAGAKRMLSMLKNNLGPYLLHILLAGLCAYLLASLLAFVVTVAMGGLSWLGAKAMGPDMSSVFLAIPLAIFGVMVMIFPELMLSLFNVASGNEWHFTIAGWLVGIYLLAVFSLVVAIALAYVSAAGVVNYHLLLKREDE